MKVSERIKELRIEREWSQEQMAERLGVSRQAITKWETGAGAPDIENLMAIAQLFGVTTDSLLFGEGYDWTNEYVVQPGQTVGQMPVGIESYFNEDVPYWPQICTATYKEVWIEPANKWMWVLSQVI